MPSEGAIPQQTLPPEFVGLPPATEAPTPEERLVVAEKYVSELLRGYQAAGQAINRLETHLFSLFKILLDNESMTWEGFVEARDSLVQHEDLLDYWDVKEIAEKLNKEAQAQEAAKAAEVAAQAAEEAAQVAEEAAQAAEEAAAEVEEDATADGSN
jgi:hypothetical protein